LHVQAKHIPNMAKNSAAQYKVVAVDDEDRLKTKMRRGQGEDGV
jgi:hypothetical protein